MFSFACPFLATGSDGLLAGVIKGDSAEGHKPFKRCNCVSGPPLGVSPLQRSSPQRLHMNIGRSHGRQRCACPQIDASRYKKFVLMFGLSQASMVEEKLLKLQPKDQQEFSLAVNKFARLRDAERALPFFEKMKKEGVTPGLESFHSAITACYRAEKGGRWQRALSVLKEMRTASVAPDQYCFSGAIWSCEKGGQWERAASLLQEMRKVGRKAGWKPNDGCFNTVTHFTSGMIPQGMDEDERTFRAVENDSLPGQYIVKDLITQEEEADLIAFLDGEDEKSNPWTWQEFNGPAYRKRWGVLMDRKGRSFMEPMHPMPQKFSPIIQRIRRIVNGPFLSDFHPNEANAINFRRDDGDFLGAHCDDRQLSGEVICTLCLGAPAVMVFDKDERPSTLKYASESEIERMKSMPKHAEVLLPPRSVHIQCDLVRFWYKHGIPNDKILDKRRVSLTFRDNMLEDHKF